MGEPHPDDAQLKMLVRMFAKHNHACLAALPLTTETPLRWPLAFPLPELATGELRWLWYCRATAAAEVAATVRSSRARPQDPLWAFSRDKLPENWREVAVDVARRVSAHR